MKLYGWLSNDRGVTKAQGGNKALHVKFEYEEPGQSWECNPSSHELHIGFRMAEDGTPEIVIQGNAAVRVKDYRTTLHGVQV